MLWRDRRSKLRRQRRPMAPSETPAEEVASLEPQQQTCPAPPPNKKGKSATGTPCAKPPKDDDDTRVRKVPATQSQDGLGDTYMDPEEQPGEATPAPSCS